MNLCDAHCHLANLSEVMPIATLLDKAVEAGITHFLSSALTKKELEFYPQLMNMNSAKILYSAGIHPNFESCNLTFEDIKELCADHKIWAIGEIGLDRGNPEYALMKEIFVRQLDLALEYRLPVVLHIVGHQSEAFEIMRSFPLRYLIHGYAGKIENLRQFLRLDSYFTISERILREDKADVLREMLKSRRFLFETDITQYYVKDGEENPLLRLKSLVEAVAQRYHIDQDILIRIQAINYQRLTGLTI
nr:TatD DNase family protein [Candidatus Cloacimonadota bacterium]